VTCGERRSIYKSDPCREIAYALVEGTIGTDMSASGHVKTDPGRRHPETTRLPETSIRRLIKSRQQLTGIEFQPLKVLDVLKFPPNGNPGRRESIPTGSCGWINAVW
jgi:hypothetical protein